MLAGGCPGARKRTRRHGPSVSDGDDAATRQRSRRLRQGGSAPRHRPRAGSPDASSACSGATAPGRPPPSARSWASWTACAGASGSMVRSLVGSDRIASPATGSPGSPQGRRAVPEMSVGENLRLGLLAGRGGGCRTCEGVGRGRDTGRDRSGRGVVEAPAAAGMPGRGEKRRRTARLRARSVPGAQGSAGHAGRGA